MDGDLYSLPPTKRFKHLHHHLLHHSSPPPPESSICLPAKKRRLADAFPNLLPAKKRIVALAPDESHQQELLAAIPEISKREKKETQFAPGDVSTEKAADDEGGDGEDEGDDDGVACSICQIGDGEPENPIVFCDGCDLTVHAACYGDPLINGVPEGDWFCLRCQAGGATAECCLCPAVGGVLKPTTDGRWAHIACALFVPEVFFRDPEGKSGIDCSRVPAMRWEGIGCYLCQMRKGCVLECTEAKCSLGFHVSCGREKELCIEYMEGKKGNDGIVVGFCGEHTKLWEKQRLTGKFKIVAKGKKTKGEIRA